ncbi:MAG: glycosyltransferase family 4 protein [Candidatus Altiarchaeota archaeon]|nr:glycosyltransferase family 4 protein [Candidatus Altiarchaeota archaeon]
METYKILMFVAGTPTESGVGGGEIVLWKTMEELAKRGHTLDVVLPKQSYIALPKIDGIIFYSASKFTGFRPLDVRSAVSWWRKSINIRNIDIIHGAKPEMILTNFWAKLKKKPLVHEVHYPRLYPYSLTDIRKEGILNHKAIRWSLHLHLDKQATKLSTKAIVPSRYSKEELKKIYKINENKIEVAYPGVDTFVFKDFGLEREQRIITVGRLEPQKGIDTLLFAFKEVLKNHPNTFLDIVGREGAKNYKSHLKNICAKEGLTRKVNFHGFLQQKEIVQLLNKASVFVMPSRIESFGIVLAEAMACGLPVVSAQVGAIPEVVRDGETGFLVRPENHIELANKIDELLDDDILPKKMGANGVRRVNSNFTWAKRIEVIEKIYSSVL